MTQTDTMNRQWILAERPTGEPTKDTLTLIEASIPSAGDSQMLLRTEYLSLDPYMRGRMSDAPSYTTPVEIGGVMVGGTVGQIGKLLGCRVVGIAGGPEKCAHAVDKLGFDTCIDHKAADFAEILASVQST